MEGLKERSLKHKSLGLVSIKVSNPHLLDHLRILGEFSFPYILFLCDTHKISRHWWYEHCMLLLISRTTVLFPIFISLVMFCILLAFLATVIYLVSMFQELFMCLLDLTLYYIRVWSNSHPDKAPFFLNKVIYMCLLSCQEAEIFITISLSFPQFRRAWYLPTCRPSPLRVLIPEQSPFWSDNPFYVNCLCDNSVTQLTTQILLHQWWPFLMCTINFPIDSGIQWFLTSCFKVTTVVLRILNKFLVYFILSICYYIFKTSDLKISTWSYELTYFW